MRNTGTTPTLTQVQSEWQPWKLSEAGTEIRTRNGEFVSLIDQTVTQIRSAGAHWSGDAYYAAYDRIAGDRDTANKVALDTEALAQTLIDSGTSLAGFRQALLDKVDQAVAAGFTVSEDWQVAPGPGTSDEDGESQYTYQTAITTALNELLGTQTDVAAKIEQASGDVSTRANQLGDGDLLDSDDSAAETDPALAVYSNPSDAAATGQEQDPAAGTPVNNSQQSNETAPASTPQSSPVAQQSTDQTGTENPKKQDSGESGDGKDKSETGEGKKPEGTGDGKTEGTGDGKDKGTGNGSEDKSSSSGPASDPNSWKPSDVTSLITSVSQIAGNVPTLIESIGKLDDDLDDIIKAGGEAGKGLIEAAGTTAEKFANAADTIAGTHQADGTPAESPSSGDPAGTGTPKQDSAATDPNAKTDDPNAKSTDSKTDNPAGTDNSKTDNNRTDKPNSPQNAETKQDQPASVRQASYSDTGNPSTAPASTSSSPSTAPASTGLLGGMSAANRQSDSEHTRRVQATPTPLFETPPDE
ncbi:hypothetical protein [Nocardia beijingensis]|uniref:Type VII secretion system (Wss) protein ESAT-6 n=1 Tax=Nocardia beijingensis TaxID=95162 RepID=A0ABW7WJ91_9NOCA